MSIPQKQIYLLLSLALFLNANSQDFSLYEKKEFNRNGKTLPYRILLPLDFDSTKQYPIIIFLHGSFEKGYDNEAQLDIGAALFLKENTRRNFPAIVIFPQCPPDDSWAYFETTIDSATGVATSWRFPFKKKPTSPSLLVKELLDSLLARRFVDSSRIYIGGISQGGMGVYDLIARYPEFFAAGFPICGAGQVNTAKLFAEQVSTWIFHGAKDQVVPPSFSRDFYKRLQKLNADVKYTEYPDAYHNSWVLALQDPELLPWLFSKSKKK